MIKIRIIETHCRGVWFEKTRKPVSDFSYQVYFFGFLIHSVTVHNILRENAEQVFMGKQIEFLKLL